MGAICRDCKGDMLKVNGCRESEILIGKRWYGRITSYDDERCGDCGAKQGFYHHMGCDIERCPKCGGQLISCGCITKGSKIRFKKMK